MRLAQLLEKYLRTHKRLDLTGLGTFLIIEPAVTEVENHKNARHEESGNITFESNPAIKQSPELVQFIADQTGKIRALAAADLESHLALAKQFLNIGNPFLFEGIGNLVKKQTGEYALKPLPGITEKTKEFVSQEREHPSGSKESLTDYKKIFYSGKLKASWRKPVIVIMVLAGLALAVWGGYTVYKKRTAKSKPVPVEKIEQVQAAPARDSVPPQKDTVITVVQNAPAGVQKFILEVCNGKRAFERYSRLKTFLWDVQMETRDSVTYKLFMLLPATPADTSRMIDSLSVLSGKRVYIE